MPQSTPLFKNIKFTENFSAVQDMYELNALIDKLYNEDKLLGFDIETGYSGKDAPGRAPNTYRRDQFIVGFSITNATNWARYVPLRHDFADNQDPNVVWSLMKPLLEEKAGVAHNIGFEAENLRNLDCKGDGPNIVIPVSEWYDSMIEAYILADIPPLLVDGSLEEGELVNRYIPPFHRTEDGFQKPEIKQFLVGLKSLTKFRYNYDQKDIHSLFNSGKELTAQQKKMIRFNTLPVSPEVVHYACDDAYLCLQLHNDQYARILEDEFLPNLYRLEMQIAEMLVEMRETGINVDWDRLRTNKDIKDTFLHEMEVDTKKKFAQEAGRDIPELNLNSPVQLQKLIFGKKEDGGMGIRGTQTTASGALSTNDKALSAVKKESPAVDGLLKYRQAKKTAEWVDLWSGLYDEAWDHKIHPSFIQVRVPSGRFASAGPNVQTLTKTWWYQKGTDSMADTIRSGTLGEDFWTDNARDMVVASPGYKLLSFDYASAEIQFLGALAKETEIIEAFHRGEDFHKWTASLMYSKDIKDITKKERQAAKAQPVSEPVLTPTGWRNMGDLKPGDYVIGGDGYPTKVLSIAPQGVKKIFRVETTIGSTRCTEDHLWTVSSQKYGAPWKTVPLSKLMSSSLRRPSGQLKWVLPNPPVIQYTPQSPLPIDPYILGLMLGDGNFTHRWAPSFCSADRELLDAVSSYHIERFGGTVQEKRRKNEEFWIQYLKCPEGTRLGGTDLRNPFRIILRELGLDDVSKENKFIPEMYFTASPEDRLALIQGLMDSDGNVLNSGGEFVNISKHLVEGIKRLVNSLGGRTSIYERLNPEPVEIMGRMCQRKDTYRAYIRLPKGVVPFRLSRKVASLKTTDAWARPRITDIVEVGEEEAQCIMVENEDGLYVTKDFIVTHNTVSFGNIYQQGLKALSETLNVTLAEAEDIQTKYFSAFPNATKFFEQQKYRAATDYEVRTWMGRKITLWEGMHESPRVRSKAARLSINTVVQGGATGDYVKLAMVNVRKRLIERGWWGKEVRLLMNQHDSLVFEHSEDIDQKELIEYLTPAISFDLTGVTGMYDTFEVFPPMSIDWETGYRWGSMVPVYAKDYSDAKELLVTLDPNITKEALKAVMDVLILNPGDCPVTVSLGDNHIQPRPINPSEALLDYLKNGDPDRGVSVKPGEFASAEYVMV